MVELMTKRFGGVAAMAAIAITLAGCMPTPQTEAIQPQTQQGESNELLAAGVGAAAGYLAGRSSTPKQQIIVQQAPAATVVHKHVTINKTVTVRKTIVRSRSARGRR